MGLWAFVCELLLTLCSLQARTVEGQRLQEQLSRSEHTNYELRLHLARSSRGSSALPTTHGGFGGTQLPHTCFCEHCVLWVELCHRCCCGLNCAIVAAVG